MPTIWRSTISSPESTLDVSFSKVCTLQVVLDWLDKRQLYGLECFWMSPVRVWAWHPNSWSGRFCGLHLSCWMSPVASLTVSKKTHGFTAGQGQEENDWPKLSSRIVSLWSTRWKHVMDNGRGWEVKHPQSTKESMSQVSGATTSRDCSNLMLWHKLLVLRAVDVCDCGRLAVIIACHKRVAWRRHCQELKNTFLLARTGLTSPLWYLDRQIKRTTLARRILAKRWQAQQANLELICFKVFPMGKSASARASSRGVPLKGEMCWSPCGMGKLVTQTLPLKIARCFHLQLQYWHSADNDATWLQNNPMSPTSITSDISGKDQIGKEFQIWFSDALSQNMGAINGRPV